MFKLCKFSLIFPLNTSLHSLQNTNVHVFPVTVTERMAVIELGDGKMAKLLR